ncbi:MAG: ROK family protein [Pseudomonadota bacterium]
MRQDHPIRTSTTGFGPALPHAADASRPLRQQVLESVRAAGRVPRVQIAKTLGISPATVTTLTSELLDAQLLEEGTEPRGASDPGRGRPPVALRVRGAAHYVAGLKLSNREHTATILTFAGDVIAEATAPGNGQAGDLESVLQTIQALLVQVCETAALTPSDLSAVGIGLPGFVSHADGRIYWSSILLERNIDLAGAVSARLGVPVSIDNDANLVALAELWFGRGRTLSDFAVVTIEYGVGMGLVLNNNLFRGSNELGLELGHTKVQLDGALCRCGQRGCLEAYVADYAMAREATTALNWTDGDARSMPVVLESLFNHAKAGNAAARTIFRRAGRYLAVGLANVINLFDPEVIILSGEQLRFDYLYADDTLAELENLVIRTGRPLPKIEVHAWGDMLWAHGAAALALGTLTDRLMAAGKDIAAQ